MAITCPVCDYQANTNEELIEHMKQMTDDKHKEALKQKVGEKGGEAMDQAKDKASDAMENMKDKI